MALDVDVNLWLDGRWVCGGVFAVTKGEQTDLCTARHDGKSIHLVAEVNERDEHYEILGRIIEMNDDRERDRNKLLIIASANEPSEVSDISDGHESFRFKVDFLR